MIPNKSFFTWFNRETPFTTLIGPWRTPIMWYWAFFPIPESWWYTFLWQWLTVSIFISIISFFTFFWLTIKISPFCILRTVYWLYDAFESIPIISRVAWILNISYALSIAKKRRRMAFNWCTFVSIPYLIFMTFFILTVWANAISMLTHTLFIEWIIDILCTWTYWNTYAWISRIIGAGWADTRV